MSSKTAPELSHESGLIASVRCHPLISMYLIMFALAWSVMIPEALASQGRLAVHLPRTLDFVMGWAPAIAAIVVSGILADRDAVRALFRRFLIWRLGIHWYLIGLFLFAAIIPGGIGLHVLFGGAMPVIPAVGRPMLITALIFVVSVLFGVVFNTEETAWRGFALPRLQTRHTPLVACALLAIPETLLHLPLFWTKTNPFYQAVGGFWFSAFSVSAIIVYAYTFNKTGGSLVIVTLLHASQNAWANLLSDNSARPFIFTVALMWLLALALILVTKGQLGFEPAQD